MQEEDSRRKRTAEKGQHAWMMRKAATIGATRTDHDYNVDDDDGGDATCDNANGDDYDIDGDGGDGDVPNDDGDDEMLSC
eukprot:9332773-Pyramimonas_sp.AAC.1